MTSILLGVFLVALSIGFWAGLIVGIITAESYQRRRIRDLYFKRFGEEAP